MYRYAQSLVAFVAVGETGAFVKAAKRLGVTPSVVSHHVTRLEEEIGQPLVFRTTRKLTLSENGRRLFDVAQKGFGSVEAVLDQIEADADELAGALRVALPAVVPDPQIEARMMEFALRYPNVALTLDYTDQRMDLVEQGYDLAVRIGSRELPNLSHRKISEVRHVLVASPDFLLQHGAVQVPSDLEPLSFISMGSGGEVFSLTKGKTQQDIRLEVCQLKVQSILAARSAALAGVGFGNVPHSLVRDDLAKGDLVQLVPDWQLPLLAVHALWPGNSRRGSLITRLVDFLCSG
jgi:DNA-binding transcriptional LysR family regulator